jgi:hypothetical protein
MTTMQVNATKTSRAGAKPGIQTRTLKEPGCEVTRVRVNGDVEVASRDGWICFWTAGREIRIGPLTPEQALKLSEDLGYDGVGS